MFVYFILIKKFLRKDKQVVGWVWLGWVFSVCALLMLGPNLKWTALLLVTPPHCEGTSGDTQCLLRLGLEPDHCHFQPSSNGQTDHMTKPSITGWGRGTASRERGGNICWAIIQSIKACTATGTAPGIETQTINSLPSHIASLLDFTAQINSL